VSLLSLAADAPGTRRSRVQQPVIRMPARAPTVAAHRRPSQLRESRAALPLPWTPPAGRPEMDRPAPQFHRVTMQDGPVTDLAVYLTQGWSMGSKRKAPRMRGISLVPRVGLEPTTLRLTAALEGSPGSAACR
jgi:hypothetical protein